MTVLKANSEGVVIGSRTLKEYKFQVINFMNMLHDNINKYDVPTCMTIGAVTHNLKCFINDVEKAKGSTLYSKEHYFKLIDAIHVNMKHVNADNKKEVIKLCDQLWEELLDVMTRDLQLEYERSE